MTHIVRDKQKLVHDQLHVYVKLELFKNSYHLFMINKAYVYKTQIVQEKLSFVHDQLSICI